MDAEHEAALARILAQREKRGHLLDRRSVTGRQNNVNAAAQDEQYQRDVDARSRQPQPTATTTTSAAPAAADSSSSSSAAANQRAQQDLTAQAQQLLTQQQQLDQERQRLSQIQEQQQRVMNEQQQRQQQQQQQQQRPASSLSQSQSQRDALSPTAPPSPIRMSESPAMGTREQSGSYSSAAPSQQRQNQQQQQQFSAAGRPIPQQQEQQQQYQQQVGTPTMPAAAAAAAGGGQQQQQPGFSQFFEKGKFNNFRTNPVIDTKDIRTIRPYVKGQAAGAKSVINFGDGGGSSAASGSVVSQQGRTTSFDQQQPQQHGADEEDQQQQQQMSMMDTSRNASAAPRSLSQQRYPSGTTPGAGAGRTPSAAQLASQARYGGFGGASAARSISAAGSTGGVQSGAHAARATSAFKSTRGGGGSASAAANPVAAQLQRELEDMNARISENNPFRNQTLDEYLVAPDEESVPAEVLQVLRAAKNPMSAVAGSAPVWNHKGDKLTAPMEGATVQPMDSVSPMFNFTTACGILVKGDWFLKWTRVKDKVHRRHFKVSPDGCLFMWGMSDETPQSMSRIIRVQDIASIEPSSIVDESTDATTYVMTIWSASRVLQIGTEYREKFDIWYETLRLLAQRQRKQNHAFSGRHATMVPESETAAATSMVMRRGMMGGKISSTD